MPDEGAVLFEGAPIGLDLRGAKSRVGYLPESNPLYEERLAAEYLEYVAELRGMGQPEARRAIADAVDETGIAEMARLDATGFYAPEDPLAEVAGTLRDLDESGETLLFLEMGSGEGDRWVRVEGDSIVYKVASWRASRILPEAGGLQGGGQRDLFPAPPSSIAQELLLPKPGEAVSRMPGWNRLNIPSGARELRVFPGREPESTDAPNPGPRPGVVTTRLDPHPVRPEPCSDAFAAA